MDDREFETFLKGRDVPEAPSNLSHRIIETAKVTSQTNSGFDFGGWLKGLMPDLMVPQPALALGMFLVLAVAMGVFGIDVFQAGQPQDYTDVSLAFYVDDLLGAEDYL